MIKLLVTSGLILLIAAGTLGIKKKVATTEAETFQPTSIVKTIEDTTVGVVLIDKTTSTPSPKSIVLKEQDLSGDRQVFITGVIDENNSPEIAKQLLDMGKDSKPITIIINSPGGSVIDGAEIISAMQAAKGPVNTICVEICASMAAMIHQYGTNRLMIDRSLVMFHPASGGVEGEVDKSFSRLSALREYIGEMELNVAKRSNISYDAYKAHSGVEWWLSAQNAVKVNIADSIVYVRGSNASKLYQGTAAMRSYYRTKLPFNSIKTNGRFYWISESAYNLLYGNGNFGISKEVTR